MSGVPTAGKPVELIGAKARFRAIPHPMQCFDGVKGGRYFLVQTIPQFEEFLAAAKTQRMLAIDTETSGLYWVHDDVCGIVVGWGVASNYYLPINHKTDLQQLNIVDISAGLSELFGNPATTKIFANAKFDLHGLRKLGLEVAGVTHDIVTMAHILDENAEHGVKPLAIRYVDKDADKWEKGINLWRLDESKRRRTLFQHMAKARTADILADATQLNVLSKKFGISLVNADPKVLKKFAQEMAKEALADQLVASNKKENVTYDFIPLPMMVPYACADVHYTYLIFKELVLQLSKFQDSVKLYTNEMALMRLLFETEHDGVKIDVDYLRSIVPQFDIEIDSLAKSIYAAVGYEFNIASTPQLVDALQTAGVKLSKVSKGTKDAHAAGRFIEVKYSVDKEVLEGLAATHPFAAQVLTYRNLEKTKTTYAIGIRELVDADNFIHPSFNQNVTTGRMSCTDPNCQNIPARDKTIRRAFVVPNDDYIFVFFDYSQIELRLTADRSQDPTLLSCYPFGAEGRDVHTITLADVVLKQPIDVVNAMKADKTGHTQTPPRGEMCKCPACRYDFYRNIAKRVNFGIIYGAGANTIQKQVSTPFEIVPKDVCQEYIDRYFRKYSGVKEWIKMTEDFMKKHGYVQNTFGRFRQLQVERGMEKWQVERLCRQGVNFLIQGEAADLFKTAALKVEKILKREKAKTRLVNFVHDEIQFYWHKKELGLLKEVKATMEDFDRYKVPIIAEIAYSPTDWSTKTALKV